MGKSWPLQTPSLLGQIETHNTDFRQERFCHDSSSVSWDFLVTGAETKQTAYTSCLSWDRRRGSGRAIDIATPGGTVFEALTLLNVFRPVR